MLLGLDISTVCVGWSLYRFTSGALDSYGKILVPGHDIFESMQFARAELLAKLEGKQIIAVGVEELNCFRGGDTTRKLAMIGGCLCMALYDRDLHPNWINTSTIKSHFNAISTSTENRALIKAQRWSKSSASKRLMLMRVNELKGLNLQFSSDKVKSDDDAADAIAVGDTLLRMLQAGSL